MADLARPASFGAARTVSRLDDPAEVLRLLREDRLTTAYALGDVDRHGQPRGEWYAAQPAALVSFTRLVHGAACYAIGAPEGLAAILDSVALPHDLYFSGPENLLPVVRERYTPSASEVMVRMAVSVARFVPASGAADRLGPDDVDAINRLYRMGSGGQISRQQVAAGVYHGIREDGRIVSVAGTHFISMRERLAAVGNVFTHPLFRGRGYATRVTGSVTAALFDRVHDVVLNVSAANPPALAAYRKLGYRDFCRFVEVYAVRRSPGLLRWIGSWFARRRSG